MTARRVRVDKLLVQRGLVASREQAQTAIMAGLVRVNGSPAVKAGSLVAEDAEVEVRGAGCPYVSRGGLKLARAIEAFGLDLRDKTVLDVGASTGGFTDCCLQMGARLVLALDVGYGQLAWKLRQDPRVRVLERTNARYLTPELVGQEGDLAVIDVSFISLTLILPAVIPCLRQGGQVVALIKPQFEAGREKVGKRGVVKDPDVHREVIARVMACGRAQGLAPKGLTFSPLLGPEGNIEYLYWGGPAPGEVDDSMVPEVVAQAHAQLLKGEA
ncbi:MAG: TlyA family RNA methyltransferase [Clostridia bacterium]|nr:MAG: TlyA family RNA methyltransferase [Clostridia bacterium]